MAQDGQSSFVGDFYWNGRMGYNLNADPAVCAPDTSTQHYDDLVHWDWSFIRLIKLGIARKLSQLDWTPDTLAGRKASACSGELPAHCDEKPHSLSASYGGPLNMTTGHAGAEVTAARLHEVF